MIDILIGNLVFWPAWIFVSNIPYMMSQYAINNCDDIKFLNIRSVLL